MKISLAETSLLEIAETLRASNNAFVDNYPGETGRRQPVHTVYGGAHLFRADTAQRDAFWKGAYELGLLVVRCGDRSIRLRPVLDVKAEIIEQALEIMDRQCRRLA